MAANKYNAETAWRYLGTDLFNGRGAYDYSVMSQLKPPARRRGSVSSELIDPTGLMNSYFNGINNYPETAIKGALSGKYIPLF